MPQYHDDPDDFDETDDLSDFRLDEPHDLHDLDDLDDLDEDEAGDADHAWPGLGSPPAGHLPPPPGWRPTGGHAARRGLLLALTAVVAAGAGFGVVAVAQRDVSGTPAASATPGSTVPSAGGATPSGGTQAGGAPSLPAGASEQLEIGGSVTAVSATSITLGAGGQSVTAAVTRATRVTGKVTSIGGIRVGDVVSALITGANGKLTADSIQDPASLPSAPGQ